MKVEFNSDTYEVHWETRKFSPKEGNNKKMELDATDCIIRKFVDGCRVDIGVGHVSQTSSDKSDSVIARKLSFVKAIKGFDRPLRKALGDEYNKTCRVVPRTLGQKNRKLKKQVAELTAKISMLEKASGCKCVEV